MQQRQHTVAARATRRSARIKQQRTRKPRGAVFHATVSVVKGPRRAVKSESGCTADTGGTSTSTSTSVSGSGSSSSGGVTRSEVRWAPRSSRLLTCDVERLMTKWLGKQVPPFHGAAMKDAAMVVSCRERCSPKFSRMSGIQQWSNAVALFVNVTGSYTNMFLDGGQHMTWYAQQRQHRETPVIKRLIEDTPRGTGTAEALKPARKEGVKAEKAPACQVVLWCRLPGQPYVFCGRLRYVSHDDTVRPIAFVWQLQDMGAMLRARSEAFNDLLNGGEHCL